MMDLLQRFIAWLANRVRVNHFQQGMRDGVPILVKRRRAGGSVVIWFGNRFLSLAGSASCMFVRATEWLDWELHCARLLYPERPGPTVVSGQCVVITKVRGMSLRQMLDRNEAHVHALVVAARELRRVHQITCSYYRAAWSHGDLHLDNILYDRDSDRAVLIDFDTRHDLRVSQTQRQGDDLTVFLAELIVSPDENWPQLAAAFVEEYREASVLGELSQQLFIPRGFARILWYARTNCTPMRRIESRLQRLREIVHRVATTASVCPEQKSVATNDGGEPIVRGTVGNRA